MKTELKTNHIYQGNALDVLKTLPDESIDCVMTSPPYWGLRDYGTATWEGGNPDCDHVERVMHASSKSTLQDHGEDGKSPYLERLSGIPYKDTCKKCGAVRKDDQIGLEPDFRDYIENLCLIFDEVKRALKNTGTCWVNLGDTYQSAPVSGKQGGFSGESAKRNKEYGTAVNVKKPRSGLPDKTLVQIPSRFAIAMSDRGWILRNEIIWYKKNVMPSSVKDRFTVDFEKIFFFTKSKKYYFEQQFEPHTLGFQRERTLEGDGKGIDERKADGSGGVAGGYEQGRNKRAVWQINPQPFSEAHFAVFPPKLVETPIKAGSPEGGAVLDPFFGSGTTGLVAEKLNRKWVGIELNPEYIEIANRRLGQQGLGI